MMLKKFVFSLVVLFALLIEIDVVRADEWDLVCNYNSGEYNLTLYAKSGITLIIDHRFDDVSVYSNATVYPEITTDEGIEDDFLVIGSYHYTFVNEVIVNDGTCPTKIYTTYDGGLFSTKYTVYYSRSSKMGIGIWEDILGNDEIIYLLDGDSPALPDIDYKNEATCEDIISTSLQELIDKYLGYIHIIVPILIIAFGTFDFFKAMISSREEDMKKSQKRFIIRLVCGVLVFLAPTIVKIIIGLLNSTACLVD